MRLLAPIRLVGRTALSVETLQRLALELAGDVAAGSAGNAAVAKRCKETVFA